MRKPKSNYSVLVFHDNLYNVLYVQKRTASHFILICRQGHFILICRQGHFIHCLLSFSKTSNWSVWILPDTKLNLVHPMIILLYSTVQCSAVLYCTVQYIQNTIKDILFLLGENILIMYIWQSKFMPTNTNSHF